MTTKQFKIGEYVVGGVIRVTVNKNTVEIKFQDYFTKKDVLGKLFSRDDDDAYHYMKEFLEDNGTYYYAMKVLDYIDSVK